MLNNKTDTDMLDTYEQHSKRKLVATALAIIVIAGTVVFADQARSKVPTKFAAVSHTSIRAVSNAQPVADSRTSQSPSVTKRAVVNSSGYKNGTYDAGSAYYVPDGNENIQVSLTLENGLITDAAIRNSEGDSTSAIYQQYFESQYKSYVIGQKISGLRLSVIAGASDTTQGFNDAISQIASKAQA